MEPGKIYPWVHGYGYSRNIYVPANPMGMSFYPLTNPRVQRVTHARALIEQKPIGFRVTGTRCHLYL